MSKTELQPVQQEIALPVPAALEGRTVVSLGDTAVVEKQKTAADMVMLDRFTIIGAEEIETQFGPRCLITALVPEDGENVWTFSLGMKKVNPGKMDLQRLQLIAVFLDNPALAMTDCALVAIPTRMGNDAYSLTSPQQRDEVERRNQQRQEIRRANQEAGLSAPIIPGGTQRALADDEIPI